MFYSHLFSTRYLQNAWPEGPIVLEGATPAGSGSQAVAMLRSILAPAKIVKTPNLKAFTLGGSTCWPLENPLSIEKTRVYGGLNLERLPLGVPHAGLGDPLSIEKTRAF